MTTQIPLPLVCTVSYDIEGLVRVPEQADILEYYDQFSERLISGLYVYGSPKSGKTHLSKLFLNKGIQQIFKVEDALNLKKKSIVLVDNMMSEIDLFCILNHVIRIDGKILIFSPVYLENIKLPDLQSRLKLLEFVEIKSPQEEFMKVLFFKQFSDHQVSIQEEVIDFLITRIPRDYQTIYTTVETLNQASIMHKRAITIPFAKETLGF